MAKIEEIQVMVIELSKSEYVDFTRMLKKSTEKIAKNLLEQLENDNKSVLTESPYYVGNSVIFQLDSDEEPCVGTIRSIIESENGSREYHILYGGIIYVRPENHLINLNSRASANQIKENIKAENYK